jgi:hypothetical protein
MWYKTLLMLVAMGTVALANAAPALAADDIHEGKVLSVSDNKISVLDNRDGETETFTVNADTKITRDGKPAKLRDILAGDKAKIIASGEGKELVAKSIEAIRALMSP